jgi:uncharacterized BrkB/YihY/UPF0761 family membrane protein
LILKFFEHLVVTYAATLAYRGLFELFPFAEVFRRICARAAVGPGNRYVLVWI